MNGQFNLVKIIYGTTNVQNTHPLSELLVQDVQFYQDKAVFNVGKFKQIFGKTRHKQSQTTQISKRVVKITNGKKSIYRLYESNPNLAANEIAMTYESKRLLGIAQIPSTETLDITKGCRFMYFWMHPNSAARISFKLGFVSCVLAIVSIALSLFIYYFC